MTTRRPGLFPRLIGLLRGRFAGWLRGREEQHPGAVYENAIAERVAQYRELKEAVAGILYMRNKLEAELDERRVELARTLEDLRRAVARSDDEVALALVTRKQALVEDLEHAERELAGVRGEAEEAKTNLLRFREEIRTLEREKGRTLASLANARARRRIQEALAGFSVDADMRALDSVREHVARLASEGVLDRELAGADDGLDGRLRAIRDESRREAAQRELAELKRRLAPKTLGSGDEAAEPVVDAVLAAAS
jgi:phage shock protein A